MHGGSCGPLPYLRRDDGMGEGMVRGRRGEKGWGTGRRLIFSGRPPGLVLSALSAVPSWSITHGGIVSPRERSASHSVI